VVKGRPAFGLLFGLLLLGYAGCGFLFGPDMGLKLQPNVGRYLVLIAGVAYLTGLAMTLPWLLSLLYRRYPPVSPHLASAGLALLAADVGVTLALAIASPPTVILSLAGGLIITTWAVVAS
jgi:hypothetical protein